ncbi:MAG: hypothetical protein AAGB16_04145 [Pseudomonadota bacterium]
MSMPIFMSEEVTIERQRPNMPNTIALNWGSSDRLHDAITIDYISGMSQRAYLFEEPNQAVFKPMLYWALDRADLRAQTNLAARYALQIEFSELDSDFFGADLAGKSTAIYRLVDRRSGEKIYENEISSNFVALYPRLNEDDASLAYDISSKPFFAAQAAFAGYALSEGVIVEAINNNDDLTDFFDGKIVEASQAAWDDVYQAYFWASGLSLIAGPTTVAARQLNPMNYLSLKFDDRILARDQAQTRFGALSKMGLSDRNGAERARQVNAQILAQSITLFLIDLSRQENVGFTHILPCNRSAEVEAEWQALMLSGKKVITDDCTAYDHEDDQQGFGIASWRQ